jgi:2-desacetyl-2-hydroxyethyl bacteriochlorophyllide A dehydrogenase
MRAALLPGVGAPLEIVERPVPEPGPGEARIRIEACGVCGSDLFLQAGGFGSNKLPVVPGHEAAGVVDAVGPDVVRPRVGDQVAIYYISNEPGAPRPNIGPGVRRMGVDLDGAFAEYVVRPVETLITVAERIDAATLAVLTDAVATPYHALAKIGHVEPGEKVAIIGIGGIGSNAVQVAVGLGADVVAISRSPERRELARSLGARTAVELADAAAACGPLGPDVVIQCAASASMNEAAIALAGYGGRVVLLATTVEAFEAKASQFVWRELSVMGSRGFTADDIRAVIDLYRAGRVRTNHLTARVRPLEEANQALEDLRGGRVLRSVLVP